jgi:DMSO/TMAO reductase YedYZ molybdopterin-dependent catalytic subunit
MQEDRTGKIVRSEEPLNLETPFDQLDGFITPTKRFYVRTHFPIPRVDKTAWQLQVEGEVEDPFQIGFDELSRLESRTISATLECAGNNRNFLEPKVKGLQWGLGAVGNASWTGVPLALLLRRAAVKPAAREIILEGVDEGPVDEPKAPRGNIRFARSIPLAKAKEDVLLAYKINDVDLPPEHGFPVRAVVPGWYAVASVKWLQRIIVIDRPFHGYYQTLDYAFWSNGELVPLTRMQIKAQIAQPVNGATIPANSVVRVHGAAWTSDAEITRVELSTDAGSTWNRAELLSESQPNAWRLWQYHWRTPAAGTARLVARATDSRARTQPTQRDSNRGTYMINHLLPVVVTIN